jgi:hypothetical protein
MATIIIDANEPMPTISEQSSKEGTPTTIQQEN